MRYKYIDDVNYNDGDDDRSNDVNENEIRSSSFQPIWLRFRLILLLILGNLRSAPPQ